MPAEAEEILKIKTSRRACDDFLAWQPEKSGVFTVRTAYKLALNELPEQCAFGASSIRPAADDPCWSRIWRAKVPPKVKTFAWKAAANALATEENKLRRNMHVTSSVIYVVWRRKAPIMPCTIVHMLTIFGVQ
jgi:hypothetical protein